APEQRLGIALHPLAQAAALAERARAVRPVEQLPALADRLVGKLAAEQLAEPGAAPGLRQEPAHDVLRCEGEHRGPPRLSRLFDRVTTAAARAAPGRRGPSGAGDEAPRLGDRLGV